MWEELYKASMTLKATLGLFFTAILAGITVTWNRYLHLKKETAKTTTEVESEKNKAEDFLASRNMMQKMTKQAQDFADALGPLTAEVATKQGRITILEQQVKNYQDRIEALEQVINTRLIVSSDGCSFIIRPFLVKSSTCPLCVFDGTEETMTFTGTSTVVNLEAEEVYRAYISFIDFWFSDRPLLSENNHKLQVIFSFDDYNTKSRQWIHELCDRLNDYHLQGKIINIQWNVMKEDEVKIDDVTLFMDGLAVPHTLNLL